MSTHRGLSLVEVLVVLGIIGILLAILAPVLNKAIYQSELAACGANLKALAAGSHAYAGDYARNYPAPPYGRVFAANYVGTVPPGTDLRPVIKDHISLKHLLCPLSPKISLTVEDAGTDGNIWANYMYWSAFRYTPSEAPHEAGMFRRGDRWSWAGNRFALIATDHDFVRDGNSAIGSHPDQDGLMVPQSRQGKNKGTESVWVKNDLGPRSKIDFNAAYDDGSVRRFGDVEPLDRRMTRVPHDRSSTELALNVPLN